MIDKKSEHDLDREMPEWSGIQVRATGRFTMGETNCPTCGTQLSDGAKIAGRRDPGVQDISICRGCAEILVLTQTAQEVALRPTTASEYLALPENAQSLLRVAYLLVRRQQRLLRAPGQLH